ncbi:hypothetical protein [Clostridium beijerinckii]|uniref:Uncharacterized protein n=1 Tax=Clostridium beijerinckii TaxID=1520 RepID=A0AAE5H7Q0_CLOBE|nr:hypothetical protein [Clostridium beijerinckii]NRT34025.1 hypothetical protein [Clostridium beijerinckii]NRT46545.1 hypothetical protein [Clostridium beijerinckii]NRT90926.1 hypothetical protein [Clostridium beijerinckii]NRZ19450.1 hypothetical protein [Clostridium beijerinckii]NSB15928.1 hypothetical protein [Clostridium beijerinckii]
MKALFGNKVLNLNELKGLKKKANEEEIKNIEYQVTKEIELTDKEYKEFIENFSKDQPWITEDDGGINEKGEFLCIRIRKAKNKKGVLVNSEGYTYPRYVAIES